MSASSLNHALLSVARDALLAAGIVDTEEPEIAFGDRTCGRYLRTTLADGTPALIYLSRCVRDEWVVSIALSPTPDAEEHMSVSAAGPRAGKVFAWGWLNRWQHNNGALGIERFCDARVHVAPGQEAALAAILSNHAVAA